MYRIDEMTVKATADEIIANYERVIKKNDLFGEYSSCINFIPYEKAKPYLKEGVKKEDWIMENDENLRNDFEYYRDWWREKVECGRGISVHRGKAQFAIRMMLAGLPEWEELFTGDGGYYQLNAYNRVAKLFGFEPITETSW